MVGASVSSVLAGRCLSRGSMTFSNAEFRLKNLPQEELFRFLSAAEWLEPENGRVLFRLIVRNRELSCPASSISQAAHPSGAPIAQPQCRRVA
ncbi:hypothetical protein MPLSOD_120297 [Mesorhizobium sp. SOD10]|nr:hypothetical protein MPLSOD_120297 [Mesorhizobium sp. SOD10]